MPGIQLTQAGGAGVLNSGGALQNAGPYSTVITGASFILNVAGTTPTTLSWASSGPPGSTAALSTSTGSAPTFTCVLPGPYNFTITDQAGTVYTLQIVAQNTATFSVFGPMLPAYLAPSAVAPPSAGGVLFCDSTNTGAASIKQSDGATRTLQLAPVTAARNNTSIMLLGDSITSGGGTGKYLGAYRNALYVLLRRTRGDVQFIGANYSPVQGADTLGFWAHQGTAGSKIEDATAGYAGFVASAGQPDIVRVLLGVNNVTASDSASTMQTKFLALMNQIRATSPSAHVMVECILPIQNGSSTVGSVSTFEATRTAFNAWLLSTMLTSYNTSRLSTVSLPSGATLTAPLSAIAGTVSLLDMTAQFGVADTQSDGIHPNITGSGRQAEAEADAFAVILPAASGLVVPRPVVQRNPSPTVKLTTAANDGLSFASVPNLNPGTGDYMIGINYRPSSLPGVAGSGGWQSVVTYGDQSGGGSSHFVLGQRSSALLLLWGTLSATIFDGPVNGITPPNASCLVLDKWHRLLVIVKQMAGGTADAALYVNGRLSGYTRGIPASTWNFTQQTLYIGKSPNYVAALGRYDGLRVWKGASVPIPGSRAALVAAEADYYEGASAVAGMSAQYEMGEGSGTTVASQVYLDTNGTFVGAPSWETILHPWDYGFFDAVP